MTYQRARNGTRLSYMEVKDNEMAIRALDERHIVGVADLVVHLVHQAAHTDRRSGILLIVITSHVDQPWASHLGRRERTRKEKKCVILLPVAISPIGQDDRLRLQKIYVVTIDPIFWWHEMSTPLSCAIN